MSMTLAAMPALRGSATVRPTVPVTVYGSILSMPAHRVCWMLRSHDVDFHYVDVMLSRAVSSALRGARGERPVLPLVVVEGERLGAPTIEQLEAALARHNLITLDS